MTTFKTSLDSVAKGITIATGILFAIIIGTHLVPAYSVSPVTTAILSAFLLGIYLYCFLFRTLAYTLNDKRIIIQRPLKNIIIDKKDIKSISEISKEDMEGLVRRFGVGGLFGYFGKFSHAKFGWMSLYATRTNKGVLIESIHHKKFLLTPDEPAAFVNQFQNRVAE